MGCVWLCGGGQLSVHSRAAETALGVNLGVVGGRLPAGDCLMDPAIQYNLEMNSCSAVPASPTIKRSLLVIRPFGGDIICNLIHSIGRAAKRQCERTQL